MVQDLQSNESEYAAEESSCFSWTATFHRRLHKSIVTGPTKLPLIYTSEIMLISN